MAENTESTAKINFKQAIIVTLITSVTTIMVTLISTKSNVAAAKPISNTSDCSDYKTQINALNDELNQSVSAENLSDISSRFFNKDDEKQILKDSLKIVISLVEDYLEDKNHYAYNLFLLKKILINKPRGNINTRIIDDDSSTYIIMQKILKDIQYYSGALSGDRIDTNKALVKFQMIQNSITPNFFNDDDLGILGNQTYTALMQHYESTN